MKSKIKKGFTLVELLVIVGILVILAAISAPALRFFQRESDLANSTEEIINTLRFAQNKTLASEGASQYGVYFDSTTSPHQYTLFKGTDFASRDSSSDEIHKLPKVVEFYEINLDGGNEAVFDRVTGETGQPGNVSLRLKVDVTKTKIVYIESSGQVGLTPSSIPTDGGIKDSRHVHFNYSRMIDTTTEKLILTFDTTVTKEIVIADYLKDDRIYWEGEVDVGGDIQKLKIHTHRLNNLDTQFCVHRDRRHNNKTLYIDISGDGGITPNLISYSADGLTTTKGSSIYVSEPEWQ
ncbi:prepilin-type N-terminal cleavage/methylation domain-containing protein [Patescibacteria group bacterium]|nr:prepilin-type N-terminal cleavage/methylation domain-containing protein [Patescibacteria group bacterium]